MTSSFVSIHDYGLQGSNFYWNKYVQYNLTKEELATVGITSDQILIHTDLIQPLTQVNDDLKQHGYCLYIKEGYRSVALYELVYRKRVEKFGKERTDTLLNMKDMPHSNGKSVDVTLWNIKTNTEVYLRKGSDGPDAFFVDFYKNKTDPESIQYQALQDLLIITMKAHGFGMGILNEYFHFNYIGVQA